MVKSVEIKDFVKYLIPNDKVFLTKEKCHARIVLPLYLGRKIGYKGYTGISDYNFMGKIALQRLNSNKIEIWYTSVDGKGFDGQVLMQPETMQITTERYIYDI